MYMIKSIPGFNKSLLIAKLFVLLCAVTACGESDEYLKEGHQYITITVSTPYNTPSTYAMDEAAENAIHTIDVLAFREEAGGEYYTYRASGTEIVSDQAEPNKKMFKVNLRKDEEIDYRFVVVANAGAELDKLPLPTTMNKEQTVRSILSVNNTHWDASSSSQFSPFPMWGETKTTMRITENTQKISDISLLRSLASIDVVITTSVQNDFKLKEVYLYNRKTRGRVVPISTHFDQVQKKVTEASMPLDNTNDPLTILDGLKYVATSNVELTRSIYAYEAPGVTKDKDLDATCIVVGGIYKTDQNPTYYRLDFADYDINGDFKNYKDLLRNHRYTLKVTSVIENGYQTPDEAFYNKKMGMTADVETWNMSTMSDVEVTGNYYLVVSQGTFDIHSTDPYHGRVLIESNHPKGWEVVTESGATWITIDKKDNSSFYFTLSALSTGSREGKIMIKTGNITKVIMVKQSAL